MSKVVNPHLDEPRLPAPEAPQLPLEPVSVPKAPEAPKPAGKPSQGK